MATYRERTAAAMWTDGTLLRDASDMARQLTNTVAHITACLLVTENYDDAEREAKRVLTEAAELALYVTKLAAKRHHNADAIAADES